MLQANCRARDFRPVRILTNLCLLATMLAWISPFETFAENCAEYNCLPILGSGATQSAGSVAVAGDFAYIADGASLRVMDVSDPTSPVTVGSVFTDGAHG